MEIECIIFAGGTTVLASMQGPLEAKQNNLKIDNATIEVSYRPKSGLPTIKDKLRESIIKGTCESALLTALHPRTTISVQIQELDNRCGVNICVYYYYFFLCLRLLRLKLVPLMLHAWQF